MGREYRMIEKGDKIDNAKNEELIDKLTSIEGKNKEVFKSSVNSLRDYYLNYLEQTNFKTLSPEDQMKKAIYFRGRRA